MAFSARCTPHVKECISIRPNGLVCKISTTCVAMAANDWGKYAVTYATQSVSQIPAFFATFAAEGLFSQKAATFQSIRFLDVAAGVGVLSSKVLDYADQTSLPLLSVTVTDFSSGMVEKAQELLSTRAHTVTKSFVTMNAQEMTFPDRSFTHLGCMFGIMFLPDRPKGLQEMFRVLDSGGCAVVGTWNRADAAALVEEFGVFAELPNFVEEYASLKAVVAICSDPAIFTQELQAAGFQDVDVHVREQTFALPNTEDTFRALLAILP